MFQGSIPADTRRMIFEAVQAWRSPRFAVACSGNFTIERILHEAGVPHILGCDVSIYTCALGAWFARKPFRLELKPEYAESLSWLAPSLESEAGKVATLMLLTGFANGLKPAPNAYYARLVSAYRQQWPELMEKTVKRLESVPLRLADFNAGDAVPWLETLPEDVAVLSFPPFFAKGYVAMWAMHDKIFSWDAPEFGEIFEEHRRRFMTALTSRPEWIVGSSERLPDLEPYLRGVSRTTSRGVVIYNYSRASPTRVVSPRQNTVPVSIPRLSPGQRLDPAAPIQLLPLNVGQFQALRAQYLNPQIKVAESSDGVGVLVGGQLVGVFAFRLGYNTPGVSPDTMYLLSDFAVAPTDYTRLAKLVLYAARSREAQLIAERMARRRMRHLFTTAFSQHPVSMKYRGLFELYSRKETPGEEHAYMLNYTALFGQWTLKEGYAEWHKKHAQTITPLMHKDLQPITPEAETHA